MPNKKLVTKKNPKSSIQYDEGAGEWNYTCPACKTKIYAPTQKEMQNQVFQHSRRQPLESRKCPNKW